MYSGIYSGMKAFGSCSLESSLAAAFILKTIQSPSFVLFHRKTSSKSIDFVFFLPFVSSSSVGIRRHLLQREKASTLFVGFAQIFLAERAVKDNLRLYAEDRGKWVVKIYFV